MDVTIPPTFSGWQAAARELLRKDVHPEVVRWHEDTTASPAPASPSGEPAALVPRRFVELAQAVAGHPARERWALLYAALWRIVHGEHDLLKDEADADVARLLRMERERPLVAPPTLFPEAPPPSAEPFVPRGAALSELRLAAAGCKGCELYQNATQTVFGQGPQDARVALVGEQPGDQEDLQGAPFVGPAGQVLDRALAEVGLDRRQVYVTNVVKHFKFVQRGKRRIHETPRDREILACQPWLEAELAAVRPEVLVCLGATAARALFGSWFRLMQQRGRFYPTPWSQRTLATLHPSAVLRADDPEGQERLYRMLADDLKTVVAAVSASAAR